MDSAAVEVVVTAGAVVMEVDVVRAAADTAAAAVEVVDTAVVMEVAAVMEVMAVDLGTPGAAVTPTVTGGITRIWLCLRIRGSFYVLVSMFGYCCCVLSARSSKSVSCS